MHYISTETLTYFQVKSSIPKSYLIIYTYCFKGFETGYECLVTTNQRKKNCGCVVDITYAGTQILHKNYELSEGKGRNNLISCCCIFRNAYSFIPSMQSRWCNKYLDCQYRREKLTTISKCAIFFANMYIPLICLVLEFQGTCQHWNNEKLLDQHQFLMVTLSTHIKQQFLQLYIYVCAVVLQLYI